MNSIKKLSTIAIFLLISVTISAQSRKITFTAQNLPIKEALAQIQQKSGYRILYNDEVVADDVRVSINVEDVPVKKLLETMLLNTELAFVLQPDNLIVITKKEFVQSGKMITGTVLDESNEPISYANVLQLALPDTTFLNGVITSANGRFALERKTHNNVLVEIKFLGYETFRKVINANNMGIIRLKPSSTLLDEVVVKGDLPLIRLKNDALVTTVQNTVLSKAGTGNDVLQRLPLLTGENGVFSVFGKGQAKIYINNREMRNTSELDNLNSADIKDVEIVTNPGARYDASVKAVIRINTVPKVGDGFGFDVRSSYYQSQNVDLTEQLNVNYRKNGWDVFGTFAFYQNEWFQDSKIRQKTFVDTLWTQANTLYSEGSSITLMGIAGLNYEISTKQNIGAKYTLSAFPPNKSVMTTTSNVYADGVFYDRWSNKEIDESKHSPSHGVNAYYNGTFGEFNVDFNTDFYTNKLLSISTMNETSEEFDDRTINSTNDVSNRLIASKLILSYPVLGGQFLLGNEYTHVRRNDEYYNLQGIVPSSNTAIHEQNNSVFTEYSRAISKVQLGAGLRFEDVRSDYFVNDMKKDEQSRKYQQWFPNFSLSTKIRDAGLQLSYTAKTRRPSYRQLSSNVSYLNRFSMQTGNPFLKPAIIHDVSFVSTWKILQFMMSYKNERDAIIYWMDQTTENQAVSILNHRNIDNIPSLMAFVSASPKIGIWSAQASTGFVKQWLTITSNNEVINLNKPIYIASLNNSFSLPKDFLLTLDMRFQSKGDVQNNSLDINKFVTNVGITKSFLDEKLSFTLKGHDIFDGNKESNILYNSKVEWRQANRYDKREIELTVRYKFNTARSKYKGTGAGGSEMNRL